MFKLFNLFKKKNKKPVSNETEKTVENITSTNKVQATREIFNPDYRKVQEIITILDKKTGFTDLSNSLKKICANIGEENFKKTDLADFLKQAESIMTAKIKDIEIKKQNLKKIEAQEFAIADIKRIGSLMSASPAKIEAMTFTLTELSGKLVGLKEKEDIINLADEFTSAFNNLKDVSYALNFTTERIDMLLEGQSQSESLNFYSKRYTELTQVYQGLQDKLNSLKISKFDLEKKLDVYKARVAKSKSNGLINLDWDGKKFAALNKIREDLVSGYEKFDAGCNFVNSNISKTINNLITANTELKVYESTLIPKLQKNVELVTPKADDLAQQKALLSETIKKEHKESKEVVSLLNLLY